MCAWVKKMMMEAEEGEGPGCEMDSREKITRNASIDQQGGSSAVLCWTERGRVETKIGGTARVRQARQLMSLEGVEWCRNRYSL